MSNDTLSKKVKNHKVLLYSENKLWQVRLDKKFLKPNLPDLILPFSPFYNPITLLRYPSVHSFITFNTFRPPPFGFFDAKGRKHHSFDEVINHLFFYQIKSNKMSDFQLCERSLKRNVALCLNDQAKNGIF
jgi:hypothetical protein